jgi:hypothetical protein
MEGQNLYGILLFFRVQIKQIVEEEMNAANQHMAFGVTSLVLVLMISPIIIFLVSSKIAQKSYIIIFHKHQS